MSNLLDQLEEIGTLDVSKCPDFEHIKARFEDSFYDFVMAKKRAAAIDAIRDEFGDSPMADRFIGDEGFLQSVTDKMDNDALVEKRFVFLSVNPEYQPTC